MSEFSTHEFGAWRSLLWPIHSHEVRRIVPMLLMIALITFVCDVLRNVKDSIIVTASGAEAIPFIKVWCVLPSAVILTIVLSKLMDRFKQEKAFYIMISGFLCFFLFFAFVLYPLRDSLHPHEIVNRMEIFSLVGFKGLVLMVRNWSFTLFYVMCEMWNGIVFSVLFWGIANEVTRVNEAHRFYGVLAVASNIASILAGQCGLWVSFYSQSWEHSLMGIVLLITACGIANMAIFRWMNRNVLSGKGLNDLVKKEEIGNKPSLKDSFSYLLNSKYLLGMAVIVISYNLILNMVEVMWKDQLRLLYPLPGDYNSYMSYLTSMIGIASTIVALVMARMIHRWGWTFTALITPIVLLVTCSGFFCFYFLQGHMDSQFSVWFGVTPLAIAVSFGAAQFCLSRAANSFFYATKEMAFIPLPSETKLKGKAVIDGIGSRLGKSGGSLIHAGLIVLCGSLAASAPFVVVILMAVNIGWIYSTKALGRRFEDLVNKESSTKIEANDEGVVIA